MLKYLSPGFQDFSHVNRNILLFYSLTPEKSQVISINFLNIFPFRVSPWHWQDVEMLKYLSPRFQDFSRVNRKCLTICYINFRNFTSVYTVNAWEIPKNINRIFRYFSRPWISPTPQGGKMLKCLLIRFHNFHTRVKCLNHGWKYLRFFRSQGQIFFLDV